MTGPSDPLPANELIDALTTFGVDSLIGDSLTDEGFSELVSAAEAATDLALKQGLQLLAAASSMRLDNTHWEQPYLPFYNIGTRRGVMPADFTPRDLEVLRWATGLDNIDLSARSADLTWIRSSSRGADSQFAKLACERWAALSIEAGSWHHGTREALERASALGARLKLVPQLVVIQSKLIDAITCSDEAWFVAQGADFLAAAGLEVSRATDVLAAVDRALNELNLELRVLQQLLTIRSRLCLALGRPEEAAEAEERQVEALLEEAQTLGGESAMVSASLLEEAYQRARKIPRKHRSERLNDLIAKLPSRIRKAGELSIDQMTSTESGGDISALVHAAQDAVRGRAPEEALAAMWALAPFARMETDRAQAEKSLEGSIMAIVSTITYAPDGRKVDSSAVDNHYGIPSATWHRMLFLYEFRVSMVSVGVVLPAMEVITSEHVINIADIRYVVEAAAFVPPSQKQLYALGLHYGVGGEFSAALHLLVPQIEASVRYHLRNAGVDTERIDPETGISNEVGLSTLMKSPLADQVFPPEIAWEIRALLCGPAGPNLRNAVAHGLIGAGAATGPHAVYLWWLAMRLVFIPYYNAIHAESDDEGAAEDLEDTSQNPDFETGTQE